MLQNFNNLIARNQQQQSALQQPPQMMGIADAMRQSTLTQCGYDNPTSSVAAMPAVMPTNTTPAPSAPDGYHYYQFNGNAYFLDLQSGNKVELGPVESSSSIRPIDLDATSFVTPSAKKERVRIKKESVSIKKERASVAHVSRRMTKKRRVDGIDDDDDEVEVIEQVEIQNAPSQDWPQTCDLPKTCDFTKDPMTKKRRVDGIDDDDDEVEVIEQVEIQNAPSQDWPQTCDLPKTCDFTKDPTKDPTSDESDGGDTVVSRDLLADSS
jgi:hypothetical protein